MSNIKALYQKTLLVLQKSLIKRNRLMLCYIVNGVVYRIELKITALIHIVAF